MNGQLANSQLPPGEATAGGADNSTATDLAVAATLPMVGSHTSPPPPSIATDAKTQAADGEPTKPALLAPTAGTANGADSVQHDVHRSPVTLGLTVAEQLHRHKAAAATAKPGEQAATAELVPNFHLYPADAVMKHLGVESLEAGLPSSEVEERRALLGSNQMKTVKGRTKLAIVIAQFINPVTFMCVGGSTEMGVGAGIRAEERCSGQLDRVCVRLDEDKHNIRIWEVVCA